jgi:hypothetical protein
MVDVEQHIGGGFERLLPQVPGGAPGQEVSGDLGHLGHAGEPKVAALRQEGSIEDGQEVVSVRFAAVEMPQVSAETRPFSTRTVPWRATSRSTWGSNSASSRPRCYRHMAPSSGAWTC